MPDQIEILSIWSLQKYLVVQYIKSNLQKAGITIPVSLYHSYVFGKMYGYRTALKYGYPLSIIVVVSFTYL